MRSVTTGIKASAAVVVSVILSSSPCFAWGSKGHYVVNQAAAELTSSPAAEFFRNNQDKLGEFANTPDGLWKRGSTYEKERGTHFFHWDIYRKSNLLGSFDGLTLQQVIRKEGKTFVDENGSAMFRVAGIYRRLVTALQKKRWPEAIQMAGVLGHYIGDISQPMHVSSDYDGQSIGRRGVHKYFETTLVDGVGHDRLFADIMDEGERKKAGFDRRRGSPSAGEAKSLAMYEGEVAFGELSDVLDHFDSDGTQDDRGLKTYYGPRMGFAAAILASIWDMAVEEAGVESGFPLKALDVEEPEWFPLADANLEDSEI